MNGQILKYLRKEKKLSQTELGEIIKVSKVSISGYETGNRTPDTDTLQRIADYFNVSTDYLLGRDDSRKEKGSDLTVESILGSNWRGDLRLKEDKETYELIEKFEVIIKSGNKEAIKQSLEFLDFVVNRNK